MADSIPQSAAMPVSEDRSSRLRILFEVIAFMGLAVASKAALSLIAWKYAGPISLLMLIGILTLYFRRIGHSWRDFGLVRLASVKSKLLVFPQAVLVFGSFAAAVGGTLALGHYFDWAFMNEMPQGVEDRWGAIEGNLPLFLLWLGIVWTAAAFGEEMFFRGYLVTRLEIGRAHV